MFFLKNLFQSAHSQHAFGLFVSDDKPKVPHEENIANNIEKAFFAGFVLLNEVNSRVAKEFVWRYGSLFTWDSENKIGEITKNSGAKLYKDYTFIYKFNRSVENLRRDYYKDKQLITKYFVKACDLKGQECKKGSEERKGIGTQMFTLKT